MLWTFNFVSWLCCLWLALLLLICCVGGVVVFWWVFALALLCVLSLLLVWPVCVLYFELVVVVSVDFALFWVFTTIVNWLVWLFVGLGYRLGFDGVGILFGLC